MCNYLLQGIKYCTCLKCPFWNEQNEVHIVHERGVGIKKFTWTERGVAKMSSLVHQGGRGGLKRQKFSPPSLWKPPNINHMIHSKHLAIVYFFLLPKKFTNVRLDCTILLRNNPTPHKVDDFKVKLGLFGFCLAMCILTKKCLQNLHQS